MSHIHRGIFLWIAVKFGLNFVLLVVENSIYRKFNLAVSLNGFVLTQLLGQYG